MKIIFFANYHQVSLRSLLKILFKQLQLILTQLIVIHVTPDSPILGFTEITQLILNVIWS